MALERVRQAEIAPVLVLAEVRRLEQLLQEHDPRTPSCSLAHEPLGPGDVLVAVPAAGHLRRRDGHLTHWVFPPEMRNWPYIAAPASSGQGWGGSPSRDGPGTLPPHPVSHAEDVSAAIARTVDRFGRLDHVFDNAGIQGSGGPIVDMAEAGSWRRHHPLARGPSGVGKDRHAGGHRRGRGMAVHRRGPLHHRPVDPGGRWLHDPRTTLMIAPAAGLVRAARRSRCRQSIGIRC